MFVCVRNLISFLSEPSLDTHTHTHNPYFFHLALASMHLWNIFISCWSKHPVQQFLPLRLNYPLRFWENCIHSFPGLTVRGKSQGDCSGRNLHTALKGLETTKDTVNFHQCDFKFHMVWYWSFTAWSLIFLREPNRGVFTVCSGSILSALCIHVNTAERNLPLQPDLLATVINSNQTCWSGDAGKGQMHMFTHRPVKEKG